MALRPLHFCEVLEEEHEALFGADDWRVVPSDVISTDTAIARCSDVFGDDFRRSVHRSITSETDEKRRKVKLAELVTDEVTGPLPPEDGQLPGTQVADLAADQRERLRRRRDDIDKDLGDVIRSRDGWTYTAEQIRNPRLAARYYREVFGTPRWAMPHVDAAKRVPEMVADLNRLVCGDDLLTTGASCRKVREKLCRDTLSLVASEKKFHESDRKYLNRRILDEILLEAVQSGPEARLAKQIDAIHKRGDTSALCLSGGGIRSATFGLGILQGLARRNLLDKFDYISTVSGGGYIGGWLSSWSRRHPSGLRGVSGDLASLPSDKLSPDPPPVQHLREFSNYLTPRVGALSGDTLTVVALYIRNLLLNLIVLLPLLIAALLVPRLLFAIDFNDVLAGLGKNARDLGTVWQTLANDTIARPFFALASLLDRWAKDGASWWYTVGLGFLSMSFIYLGATRPARNKYRGRRRPRLLSIGIMPLVAASAAFATAWARRPVTEPAMMPWLELVGIAAILPIAAIFYGLRFRLISMTDQRETLFGQLRGLITRGKRFRIELWAVLVGIVTIVVLLGLLVQVFPAPAQAIELSTFPSPILTLAEDPPMRALYVVFAVPLILGVFFVCSAIFVAIASHVNQDYDREWWARCSGMTFAAIVIWILLTGTVVFGPVFIHLAPTLAVSVGGMTGIASYVLSRYRAMLDKSKSGTSKVAEAALSYVAPVFVVTMLAFISLGTSIFFAAPNGIDERAATQLQNVSWQSKRPHALAPVAAMVGDKFKDQARKISEQQGVPKLESGGDLEVTTSTLPRPMVSTERIAAWNHLRSLEATQFGTTAAVILALVLLAMLASWCVNVNKFSMHSMYRNRLIRAYLGASRMQRDPNPITGFDPQDDLPMHALRPEFLWVASFRDVTAFFQQLRDDFTDPFVDRFRKEVYLVRSREDLEKDSGRDDFDAELAQVVNCVLEKVDLSTSRSQPVVPPSHVPPLIGKAWHAIRDHFFKDEDSGRRLSGSVLRRNRELLDQAFATSLFAYDHPIVKPADIADVEVLRAQLMNPSTKFRELLVAALGTDGMKLLPNLRHSNRLLHQHIEAFTRELNRVMEQYDFDRTKATLDGFAKIDQYPTSSHRLRENRRILDGELRPALHHLRSPRPMHIVNMALNLVRGDNLAWQERKAESFTTSPMHTGSYLLGYRDSSHYGDPSGITLGTVVAISGAAVSPNRGQKTSSALAFLMTLFNVRLGWWLGNPGVHGQRTWRKEGPKLSTAPLLAEATGDTNDCFPYVYLSDGGHFENLGLYEMVLRRRHYIVISDATCDRKYAFDDLGNAIRKIRTDLGVPIDIDKLYIYPKGSEKLGKYCALGTIRYSCVDEGGRDGKLLYIKPGVYMNEPADIFNYAKTSSDFPHETTADQWFSESQFESYRMLGSHIIDQICNGAGLKDPNDESALIEAHNWCAKSMKEFFEKARDYLDRTQDASSPKPDTLFTSGRFRRRAEKREKIRRESSSTSG